MAANYGKASIELFTQFLARIDVELPKCTLAIFSTLKYTNAPNFEKFRERWQAKYLGGFIFLSKYFEDLKGKFPVGFLIWDMANPQPINKVLTDIVDYNDKGKLQTMGQKLFFPTPNEKLLNVWIERPSLGKNPIPVVPLSNVFKPYQTNPLVDRLPSNGIGYFMCNSNDFQHAAQLTFIMSSAVGSGHGMYIVPDNLWQVAVVFTVRHIEKHTWTNHNDQFYKPNKNLSADFISDCFVYMLWHDKNLTASCELEWKGKKWRVKNHFVPFLEAEVKTNGVFDSHLIYDHLQTQKLSREAKNLMEEGKKLWTLFHQSSFDNKTKKEYQLSNTSAGWYQVRRALESVNYDFTSFKDARDALHQKLRPQCYEYGFIKK